MPSYFVIANLKEALADIKAIAWLSSHPLFWFSIHPPTPNLKYTPRVVPSERQKADRAEQLTKAQKAKFEQF